MTDKELIKKWLKVKLAELYEESQCEVPEISQEIIKGKMISIKESLSFIDSMQKEYVNYDKLNTMLDDALAKETKESLNERLGISQEEHDRIVDECIYGKEPELVDADDLPKEEPMPKFKAGDHIRPIDSSLGSPRTIVKVCDGWYVTNQGTLDFEFEDNWELAEEHKKCMYSKDNYTDEDRKVLCDGCEEEGEYNKKEEPVSEEWIEELRTKLGSMSKEDFKKVFDKYAVDFNEEPVSEDLEKIVEEIAEPTILNAYGTKELARRLRATMCGTSVSEDLGEYINELSKQFPEVSFAKLSRIAVRVDKWQKQQIMKDAVEGVITFDYYRDGDKTYGCIAHESFCLEDLGLNDGDKVKLIIIKED